MRKLYLTLKYTKPIPVQYKDEFDMFNMLGMYIDAYGECFIGLFNSEEEALEQQELYYVLFGDKDICRDLNTLEHLDRCLALTKE